MSIDALIRCLRERGHLLYLVTRKLPRAPLTEDLRGVKIFRVGPSRTSFFHRVLLGLNQGLTITKIFRRRRMDVIETHGYSSMIAGLIAKEIYGAPLILTLHGFPRLVSKDLRLEKPWKYFLSYPFERFLIRKANKVIVRSSLMAQILISVYGADIKERIEVIPHQVDLTVFKYTPPRTTGRPVVLFVGTLSRVHGAELLIRAAPLVLKQLPKTIFLIVGDGPLRPQLEKLAYELNIVESVIFVGFVRDREKLASYYQAANVVVVPLRYKGYILSQVAVEALATGRPVVTTMLVDHSLREVGVFLVDKYNPDELARVVTEVLSNKERLKTLSLSARKFMEERHSKKTYLSQLEKIYINVIQN